MSHGPITIQYQGSQLMAVPAIHDHHVFANEVNRICRSPEIRPEAIAVELGPETAEEAASWLKELGVGRERSREFPVMLGLSMPNRMIRASLKKRAFELQRDSGKDLSELPLEILHRELGYAGYGLLCLTPTDSIIEAIRCALELEIPIYGVDLEEMADGDRGSVIVQDPTGADGNVAAYIAQNAAYAGQQQDEEVDTRREIAMAARVKALLKMYQSVLFTCGMGHWVRILSHLKDPSIRPAILGDAPGKTSGNFKRVVVHPQIAINHMGLFPALVSEYQKARRPANESDSRSNSAIKLNPTRIFEELMHQTYRDYFCADGADQDSSQRSQDLSLLSGFEAYLANLCLVNLRLIPDLFMTIKAAQGMMSKAFVKALTKKFTDFLWALPQEHSECSLLAPFWDNGEDSACTLYGKGESEDGEYFYVRSIPANKRYSFEVKIPFEWKEGDENRKESISRGVLHTWIPWDYLISSLSLRGADLAKKWEHERSVEAFEGSLLDGIAIKETIRAFARGKDHLYVYDTVKKKRSSNALFTGDGFPVVFILEPGEHSGSQWAPLYVECSWVEKYVRDRQHFEDVRKKRGNKMISLIGYGDQGVETRVSKENPSIRTDRYYGITIYQPDCWETQQFARWMEMTHYKRNLFCNSNMLDENFPSDLSASLKKEHGIRIGEFDWSTTLMLLAIPFAKERVTAVVPDNFEFHPAVFERAKRYGVEVCIVSLGSFTQQEIDRLSYNHMAPAKKYDPKCLFDRSVEEAIGELQTDNLHLVPRSCLNFGKY